MALAGKVGAVYAQTVTGGVPTAGTPFTDQATTADAAKKRYTINDTTKRFWDRMAAVTVKKNGVVQTTGFTLEYAGGVIVFDVALTTEVILVSATSLPVAQVAGFFNWKLDKDSDLEEVTTFLSNGWKELLATLNDVKGSAEQYWVNHDLATLQGTDAAEIIVLYIDAGATKRRYEFYAHLKKDGVETPVAGVVKKSIEFQADGPVYYREG